MTLNEEQGEVLPWRRTRRRTSGVWRAERRCRGDDVNMVKLAMSFTINEEKGEVLPWRRTRRRLRCGSTSSRIRCQLVMLALMLHELDIGTQVMSSYPVRVERKAPRNVSWRSVFKLFHGPHFWGLSCPCRERESKRVRE